MSLGSVGGGSGAGSSAGDAGASAGGAGTGTGGGGDATSGTGGAGSGAGSGGGTGGNSGGNTAPPAAAASSNSLGDGGKAAANWRDSLPPELKDDPTLTKFSDTTNLAKSYVEMQKMMGQKNAGAIIKPGKDASPEAIKAFREALGIPTDADKYDMGAFEGIEVDQSVVDWAKKMGSEHGVEPAALKAIITDYMKTDAQNETAIETAALQDMRAGLETLKGEWGDGFERNLQRANLAAEKTGGKELVERLMEFGAHNDPLILKHFEHVSRLLGEDTLREGGVGDGRSTPAELDGKIASVQKQLMDSKLQGPMRQSLLKESENLYKQRYGNK